MLYAFSTQKWKRPKSEVDFLMRLLAKFLVDKKESFLKNGINFKAVGDITKFSDDLKEKIENTQNFTQNCAKLNLNLAINYGARDEIVHAMREIAACGAKECEITPELIEEHLYTAGIPDPDILIRTGGEKRISNYLLWQIAYSEVVVINEFWPEFNKDCLQKCIDEFNQRQRRYGK